MYVLGGLSRNKVPFSSFERYEVESDFWEELANIPKPLYKATACEFDSILYFTDFSARMVFTYETRNGRFGNVISKIPENTGKVICALHDEILVITNETSLKLDTITGKINKTVPISLPDELVPNSP